MRLQLVLSLWVFSLLATTPGSAQERPEPTVVTAGARALGLAFSTTATANDVYAISGNPAGLATLEHPQFGITGRAFISVVQPRVVSTESGIAAELEGLTDAALALDAIQFAGIAVPLTIFGRRLTAGLAWHRFTEGVREASYHTQVTTQNGRFSSNSRFSNDGGLRALSPSIALRLAEPVSVGITASFLHGESNFESVGPHYFTVGNLGAYPDSQRVVRTRELDQRGLAFTLGGLARVNARWEVGAQLTLPHERRMTVENSTSSRAATMRIPAELAIGAAYRLSPHTRIVSDLRAADWSTSTLREDASGDDVPRLVGVRDVRSLHVGLERDLSVERGRAAVRTGAFIRRSSAEDIDGAQLSAWGLSIGESWKLKTTVLDIGLLMTRSSRWRRTEDTEARTTLRNFDVILAVGLRGA